MSSISDRGVELRSGERINASHAVVANLTPAVLFGSLLEDHPLPDAFRQKVEQYHYGPRTMMIHLSLNDLPKWAVADDISEFAHIHIGPYIDDLATTYTQTVTG